MFLCESFVWKGIHQISKAEVTSNVANYYSVFTDVFSSLSEFSFLTQVLGLSLWSYLVGYVCAILLVHLSIICGWLKERQWILSSSVSQISSKLQEAACLDAFFEENKTKQNNTTLFFSLLCKTEAAYHAQQCWMLQRSKRKLMAVPLQSGKKKTPSFITKEDIFFFPQCHVLAWVQILPSLEGYLMC